MLVSAFSTPVAGLLRKQRMPNDLVKRLWPLQSKQIDWPLRHAVDGPLAETIGTAVIDAAQRVLARRIMPEFND
jgi:hypothetical protein